MLNLGTDFLSWSVGLVSCFHDNVVGSTALTLTAHKPWPILDSFLLSAVQAYRVRSGPREPQAFQEQGTVLVMCGHWLPSSFVLIPDTILSDWGSFSVWALERQRRKQVSHRAQQVKPASWKTLHREMEKIVSLKLPWMSYTRDVNSKGYSISSSCNEKMALKATSTPSNF